RPVRNSPLKSPVCRQLYTHGTAATSSLVMTSSSRNLSATRTASTSSPSSALTAVNTSPRPATMSLWTMAKDSSESMRVTVASSWRVGAARREYAAVGLIGLDGDDRVVAVVE